VKARAIKFVSVLFCHGLETSGKRCSQVRSNTLRYNV